MCSKRKSHTLGLYVSRNQRIFLFMPNCYEMEILSKSWLFVMIWQMDISQGSVLVSVFCLTRCNYKQCCLFAHLASGYHVRPGLSSPHVIRCPMSHLTRGAGIIEMEFCVKWEYDPGLQWPQSGCLGFESPDPDVANMTIRDTDIPSHADINQSNGPMLSVRHHIPILIHAPSRPIIRLYKMYSAFFKVVYWERVCYQMVQELSEELFRVLIKPMWVRNVLREKSSLINYFFLLALEGWNNFCVSGRKVEKWLQRERGN